MESVVSHSIENFYRDKRVFITGHTGFKGTWLTMLLYTLGAKIKGYALAPLPEQSFYSDIANHISIESVFADIRDREKLNNEIQEFKPDFIFHLAAQALVRVSYKRPSETFEINTIGTSNVLEALSTLNNKCSIVVITTDKVYENFESDHFYSEQDQLGGYDPYSASKAAAELVVNSFRNSFFKPADFLIHQKSIATARAGNVIGGGDRSPYRIVPDIIRFLKDNKPVELRNPFSIRPWQHVLEPLVGYLILGRYLDEDPIKYAGAYNFGPLPQDHLSVKDLVEYMIAYWGSGTWVNTSTNLQPHEAGLLKLNIEKAKTLLHWQPRLTSKEAIEWTINWFKQDPAQIFDYTCFQINNYLAL